jgi:hypothetical protein
MSKRSKSYGNLSDVTQFFVFYASLALSKIDPISFKLKSLLETADYRIFLANQFGSKPTHKNKKSLILSVLEWQERAEETHYIEFGVAFGETAKLISQNAKGLYFYSGFDTFEGLPESWRRLKVGAFSNQGQIPIIGLPNFEFHKGLIKNTIRDIQLRKETNKVILFDFDLYEPTLLAFNFVEPYLKKGDILYFDEAFDSAERTILENYVLRKFEVKHLASTSFAIALIIL